MKEPDTIDLDPNVNTSISAGSLGIKPIKEYTWTFFDKELFDASTNSKMVSIAELVQTKAHVPDPDVINGKKPHPVKKAYSYFLRRAAKDLSVSPREPITVTANADGTYNIVDGYATVTAAMFVGWKSVPVIVVEDPADPDLKAGTDA
jgi:hypothetical protein